MPKVEVVKYFWREFYVRVTYDDGRTFHSEPWNTEEAAGYCVRLFEQRLVAGRPLRPW